MANRNVFAVHIAALCLLAMTCGSACAGDRDTDYQWQLARLLSPTKAQLGYEKLGEVFIYKGMKSSDIDKAMDKAFDRIQYMMFINTVHANNQGEPQRDPVSNEPIVDDDGC